MHRSQEDARGKPLSLAVAGRKPVSRIHEGANRRAESAPPRGGSASQFEIRPIARSDNAAVAKMLRQVLSEFGVRGAGCSANDPEIDDMYRAYRPPAAAYFVLAFKDRVAGGAGIARLKGGDRDVCELQKMYFLPEARGLGCGQKLMEKCLRAAREAGYKRCYLETMENMTGARRLYSRNGFKQLPRPLGDTGHSICQVWYLKELGRR